jgi:hypothetical protein
MIGDDALNGSPYSFPSTRPSATIDPNSSSRGSPCPRREQRVEVEDLVALGERARQLREQVEAE